MIKRRAIAGQDNNYRLNARGERILNWKPFLGDIVRAPNAEGRMLTVKFHNTVQRDAWLKKYREQNADSSVRG